ncbi:MAG: hypothetical protein JRJ41_02525 [Deltaproteobacteria bacterium]|nr:hypothetical protein [Deltaproteobacteria bacterium]
MLQRYDISLDSKTNCLSIKEFAVLERKSRKSEHLDPAEENYSLIHEETYEVDIIRKAINNGEGALITELRSDNFFPIQPYMKIISDSVIELLDDNSNNFTELFFDDRTLLS